MPELLRHSEEASSAGAVNNGRTKARASLDIVARSFDLGQAVLAKRNGRARKQLGQFPTPPTKGITIHTHIHQADFVLAHAPVTQPSLFPADDSLGEQANTTYDLIIANPPYFKLNRDDPRVVAVVGRVKGHTNICTLFYCSAQLLLWGLFRRFSP